MTLTPEQFNKLATKEDLREFKEEMRSEMVTKNEFRALITAVDNLTKIVTDFRIEMASNQAAHDRFKYRISKLEGKEMVLRDEDEDKKYSK